MARLDARMCDVCWMAAQIKTGMIVLFPGWLTHQALLGSHVSHNAYIAVVHSRLLKCTAVKAHSAAGLAP